MEIMNAIQDYSAVASIDASIKRHYMGANWTLSDTTNDNEESEIIWSNKQTNNIIIVAKASILYNLIKMIQIKTVDMTEGSIEFFYDSSKAVNSINDRLMNDS